MWTGGEWERIGEVRKRTDVPLHPGIHKDRYNVEIRNKRVSPKVPPTTYVDRRMKGRRCEGVEWTITNKEKVNDF
jgi:hypothetical protein